VTEPPPKIVFPCSYPIKVLGRAGEDFQPAVMSIFNERAPGFESGDIHIKDSRNGTFQSITITIEAQSAEQLRLIHQDLMGTGLVSMVL
jgi:putative lipoic acid-binding regulatory protein